jgi:hypothetical protein
MAKVTYRIEQHACGGGNHFDVTIETPLGNHTFRADIVHLTESPTKREIIEALTVILRAVIMEIPDLTHQETYDRINGLELDITPGAAP